MATGFIGQQIAAASSDATQRPFPPTEHLQRETTALEKSKLAIVSEIRQYLYGFCWNRAFAHAVLIIQLQVALLQPVDPPVWNLLDVVINGHNLLQTIVPQADDFVRRNELDPLVIRQIAAVVDDQTVLFSRDFQPVSSGDERYVDVAVISQTHVLDRSEQQVAVLEAVADHVARRVVYADAGHDRVLDRAAEVVFGAA